MKGEEERNFSAPLVLSQERSEDVSRKLTSLEEKLKRLQVSGGEQGKRDGENKETNCAGSTTGTHRSDKGWGKIQVGHLGFCRIFGENGTKVAAKETRE